MVSSYREFSNDRILLYRATYGGKFTVVCHYKTIKKPTAKQYTLTVKEWD